MLERAARGRRQGLEVASRSATPRRCRTKTVVRRRQLGVRAHLRPDHGAARARSPASARGRLGFTAWQPELRSSTCIAGFDLDAPEGTSVRLGAKRTRVEELLGADFALEFEEGTSGSGRRDRRELRAVVARAASGDDLAGLDEGAGAAPRGDSLLRVCERIGTAIASARARTSSFSGPKMSCERGRRPPPAPDPAGHRQSAGQRDARQRSFCASTSRTTGCSASSTRARCRARQPRRAHPGAAARACSSSPTRTPCSPIPPSGRSIRGRARCGTVSVWGRGALDMKGQAAASAVAIASLAREGFEPAGDLIFAACADEEVGEGGSTAAVAVRGAPAGRRGRVRRQRGRRRPHRCSTAVSSTSARWRRRWSAPLKLTVRGRSGHGSRPGIADNALVKAAPLIERLGEYRPSPSSARGRGLPARRSCGDVPPSEAVVAAREVVERVAARIARAALLSLTVVADDDRGVAETERHPRALRGDGRRPPAPRQTEAEIETAVRELLGGGDYDLEWAAGYGGTRSPRDSALGRRVVRADVEPGASWRHLSCSGSPDSHWVRRSSAPSRTGSSPIARWRPSWPQLIHSADERCGVEDLELGVEFLRHVARLGGRFLRIGTPPALRLSGMAGQLRMGGERIRLAVWPCRTASSSTGRRLGGGGSDARRASSRSPGDLKRFVAAELDRPILRGPARLLEAFAVLPHARQASDQRGCRSSAPS